MRNKLGLMIVAALVIGLGVAGFVPASGEKDKDKKTEVEGAWKLDKGGKGAPAKLVFKNREFTLTFDEERVYKGTFTIDTKENPSWMDLTFVSGPDDKFKDKKALCIYNFDGEFFMWCASMPGSKRRPPQFVEIMGDARLLLGYYKMEKK